MNLSDLNSLDFNEIGSWPVAARAGAIAFICVVVLGLGLWFDSRGQSELLDNAEAKENGLKSQFEAKQRQAANLDAYKQQLEEMRRSFGTMLKQLPSKTEVADLLVDVSQTGLASGLEFELFKPDAEIPKDFYAELPIKIRVIGDYHNFGEFISGVAGLPRIVTLHDIDIKPTKSDKGPLAMDLTAKTYRYLEAEE